MVCKRCEELIRKTDFVGIYGCVHCAHNGLTYNIREREDYIIARCGIYDSASDVNGEYDHIWNMNKNEPTKEAIEVTNIVMTPTPDGAA